MDTKLLNVSVEYGPAARQAFKAIPHVRTNGLGAVFKYAGSSTLLVDPGAIQQEGDLSVVRHRADGTGSLVITLASGSEGGVVTFKDPNGATLVKLTLRQLIT